MASNYYKSSIFNLQLQNWKTKDIQQSKPEAAERLAGTRSRISCITSVGSTPPLSIARSSRARSDAIAAGSGGCTPRATRAMARGSAQKIAKEAQKIAEEE